MFAGLGQTGIMVRWTWKTKPSGRQSFRNRLEGYSRQTKGQSKQASHGTPQRVPRQPDICVRVELCHVGVQVNCGSVVPIFTVDRLIDTSQIGRVGLSLTIADLPPKVRASLAAATTEKEVVILLVIRGGSCPIKESWGSALQ